MDNNNESPVTGRSTLEINSNHPTVIPTAEPTSLPKANTPQKVKARSLPIIERRNWLIHLHYVRKDYLTCKSLIKEQLRESQGQCEYAIYIQAMILRNEGNIQNSLELFQACHLLNPSNPDNLKQVARNLVLLGKHKSAIECYNKAAALSQKDWDICHGLGVCYQFLKDTDEAVKHFNDALSRTQHVITYDILSKLYIENGEIEKAIDVLKKGVEFAPENIDLLTSLGLLYLQKQNFHRAFELLGQVLTYDPENYKAILAVSSLMQRHADYDVALSKYRVAAYCVPESSSVWNNIGLCYFGKKKTVPAISCLKRAHYHSPFDWKILYNLSFIHLTIQQYVSAFHFASAAIALRPKHGPLFVLLAIALSNLDQPENAQRAYEQAMALSPDDLYLLVNYCIFLHNNGRNQDAAKVMSTLHQKFSLEQLQKDNREVSDVCKKLAAALHLGDKMVSESEKVTKKRSRSKTNLGASTSSAQKYDAPHPSEGARSLKEEKSVPSEISSESTVTLPSGKLPPLLPRASLDDQEVEDILSRDVRKRERKQKKLSQTAELAPLREAKRDKSLSDVDGYKLLLGPQLTYSSGQGTQEDG